MFPHENQRGKSQESIAVAVPDSVCIDACFSLFHILSFEEKPNEFCLIDEILRLCHCDQLHERRQRTMNDLLNATNHFLGVETNECSHRFVGD